MSYYKYGKTILDNRHFFPTSSIEYEKNVHTINVQNEDNMQQQQNYTYGNPIQDDIYQYRYDSFLTGSRDSDIPIMPIVDIKIPNKSVESKPTPPSSEENHFCGVGEDGVNVCGKNLNLYKILDPRFNLREAAKNMILLEDHLFQCGKRCADCIKKHCLMIEGFLEEGITLDSKREYVKEFEKSNDEFRNVFKNISEKLAKDDLSDEDCANFAQQIRKIRKPLCQKYSTFF